MSKLHKFLEIFNKVKLLLSHQQKRKSIKVFFCIILSSFLELISVSAILPLIYALLESDKLLKNPAINFLNIQNSVNLIYLISLGILFIFILRAIGLMWANWVRIEFENTIMKSMSDQMMDCYICRPYEEAMDITTAEAVRGIGTSATSVYYVLQSFFLFFTNILSAILIAAFLVSVDALMAIELSVIGGTFVAVFLAMTRKKIRIGGAAFNESMLLTTQYMTEAISGLKEITVLRKQKYFIEKLESITTKKKIAEQGYRYIQYYPNIIIQTIFVSIVIVVACLSLYLGAETSTILPNLIAFGYGSIKIIPAISAISTCLTTLLYYYDSFNDAYKNITQGRKYIYNKKVFCEDIDEKDKEPINFEKITVHNLFWQYKGSDKKVLDNLNLTIHRGECIGIVGKSGAGKSTLADVLLGLLNPHIAGCIKADSVDIYTKPVKWAHTVGYVPQKVFLMDASIKDNILFGEEYNEQKIWKALEQAQIKDFVLGLPNGIHTLIGEDGSKLSGGQKQRIVLARALFNDPSLLILDEATSALDNETEKAVMESINYLLGKKTMIIIAHRLSTIENCNRVYEIVDGRAILKHEKV